MEIKIVCSINNRHVINIPLDKNLHIINAIVIRDPRPLGKPIYRLDPEKNYPLNRCKSCQHALRCITNRCNENVFKLWK